MNLRFDRRPAPRVVGGVVGGREVLEVVGHDGVEDERLHQVPVAWTPTTTRSTVSLIYFNMRPSQRGHGRMDPSLSQ